VYVSEIKRKNFKKVGKVAVIIPTKGKVEMLKECVDSFHEHCDKEKYDIFVADTGSTEDEKNWIKKNINDITLIEYDYYNFAKINNNVVKNLPNDVYDFLLFSNNDIKILNDIISGMLSVFESNKLCGTVGCRLHFEDNTIQHDGVFVGINQTNGSVGAGHINLKNYYNYSINTKEVFGNTGGLMMTRKTIFEKNNMFNENYISCFEDVEYNIILNSIGLKNYTCGECVAYHYESTTRNEDPKNLDKLRYDYMTNLIPSIKKNLDKIKHKIVPIQ
jgi:GT2 family glycosyltransferase